MGHASARGRLGGSRRDRVRARGRVRAAGRDQSLGPARTTDHVRGGSRRTGRARRLVARGPRGAERHDRDRLPALRHDPGVRDHGLPERRVRPRADRDPGDGRRRPHPARRQRRPRHGDDLRGPQRRGRAWDRRVRLRRRPPDRGGRDRGQRAREPHPGLVRGAGRERQREGLPHRGQQGPRHEQHRDRRDRLRGHRARSHRRPGARRDRARQRGVERRQLREPRLRQRPERRRHLRRRRPRHPDRGQHRSTT